MTIDEPPLEAVLQQVSELVVIQDPTGRITFASAAASTIIGVEPAMVVGTVLADWIDPAHRARFEVARRSVVESDQVQATTVRLLDAPDGSPRWVACRLSPAGPVGSGAGVIGVLGVTGMDADTRRLRPLRLTVTRLANEGGKQALPEIVGEILDQLGWPWGRVLSVGSLGHVTLVAQVPERPARPVTLSRELVSIVTQRRDAPRLEVTEIPGERGAVLFLPLTTLSRLEDVLLFGLPPEEQVPSPAVLATLEEVRAQTELLLERRRISRELERSNEELARFAYVASHDLQEPLRKITGFLGLLAERYADELDEVAREYIDFAVGGASRMQQLISDLLAYASVGRAGQSPTLVDLAQVVADVVERLTVTEGAIHVTPLPTVFGHLPELRQLFENLLGNATKFAGPEGPDVTIRATERAGRVLIEVSDTGIGIPPDQVDKVFDPFFRGHPARRYPGTGVGLAICRKVVEHHEGTIDLTSTPGVGTTVRIDLPGVQP